MKNILLASAAVVMLLGGTGGLAHATNNSNGPQNNNVTNNNNPTAVAGAAAIAGAAASTRVRVNNTNVNANRNANRNANANQNVVTTTVTQSGGPGGNSGGGTNYIDRQGPASLGLGTIPNSSHCWVGIQAGASDSALAGLFGIPIPDFITSCLAINEANALLALELPGAARQRLCRDSDMRRAMREDAAMSGVASVCYADRPQTVTATPVTNNVPATVTVAPVQLRPVCQPMRNETATDRLTREANCR